MLIIAFILVLVIAVVVCMALGAVTVAAAGAMFLHQPFVWSWHQAWNRWGFLILFTFVLLPILALRRSSN